MSWCLKHVFSAETLGTSISCMQNAINTQVLSQDKTQLKRNKNSTHMMVIIETSIQMIDQIMESWCIP
jgi:hypothetical protein